MSSSRHRGVHRAGCGTCGAIFLQVAADCAIDNVEVAVVGGHAGGAAGERLGDVALFTQRVGRGRVDEHLADGALIRGPAACKGRNDPYFAVVQERRGVVHVSGSRLRARPRARREVEAVDGAHAAAAEEAQRAVQHVRARLLTPARHAGRRQLRGTVTSGTVSSPRRDECQTAAL
eukprot:916181-Pleurochrysis_carterae.AAC.2